MATTDRHPQWLDKRLRLFSEANALPCESKAFDDHCAAMSELDVKLITTPARNPAEAYARLQYAAAINGEGSVLNGDDAADLITNVVEILAPLTPPAEPLSWDQAVTAYVVAKANEQAFDDANGISFSKVPGGPEHKAMLDRISNEAWAESSRLGDIRGDAEDVLMTIPSPDAAAFAFKYLIAHGGGRETDGWDGMLEVEAKRLAGA